jgi:hypothetical protein
MLSLMEEMTMRPLETRTFLKDLNRWCKRSRLELVRVPSKGKGSHQGLVFRRQSEGSLTVVIPGHCDLSPGVQRELLRYVLEQTARVSIAVEVYDILACLFQVQHVSALQHNERLPRADRRNK